MRESMMLVGGIMIILGVSRASTNFMIDAGVPQMLLEWVGGFVTGEIAFLVLLLLFLLALGAILDIFSAIVLVVPLVLPVAAQFGVHPVHLGIVFLAAMQLGYITPPVGLNLFIASYRFQRPVISLYVSTLPFFAALLLAVVIITFWPWLSLALL
jgi:TRAP-type C4-dicarboxylate transport system permease large subunit